MFDDQPWYDSAIRRLSRKRARTKSLAKYSGKPALWLKYKNIQNRVNNMKKYEKENFLKILNCNDKKGLWKIIKHFVKKLNSVS